MLRARILFAAVAMTGCSYFQRGTETPAPGGSGPSRPGASAAKITKAPTLIKAMHDRYAGKFFKTLSFLQNNTAYTATGQEQHSQWYEHMEVPGKLRIAFLPAKQKSGLVQVDDEVASFDNGIRVDFRPSVNPLLVMTADVFATPTANILRELDSLDVDTDLIRTDEWKGRPVYVVGAARDDTTSNQMWVDSERLLLVRFIQTAKRGDRVIISDIRVEKYTDIDGVPVASEFLVTRNGRPVWREQYANIRLNETFPAGVFDQARWNDIPIPQ